MKRLLYIAFHDCENELLGVQSKIWSQCCAFEEYGYRVDLIERKGTNTILQCGEKSTQTIKLHRKLIKNYYVRSVLDKQNQMHDIKTYLQDKNYDACYIRYDFSDPNFILLLKKIQKSCLMVVLELPTYPYEAENQKSFLSRVKLKVDMFFRKQLHNYIDFIVTFYDGYKTLFDIPVQVVPNGFDFSTMKLVSQNLPSDGIHMIAVSSMREWHGYERMIEGIREYYKSGEDGKNNIILHLVGKGREYKKYKNLIESYGLQEHVILEGVMHGKLLDELYEKCALGIDSLARHRSGIEVLSSLKSREYGAKGIPMINSCKIDILENDFPYLLRVDADETPINMEHVIEFYDRCYASGKSRIEIGKEIRDYVEKKSGMKQTLNEIVKCLEKKCSSIGENMFYYAVAMAISLLLIHFNTTVYQLPDGRKMKRFKNMKSCFMALFPLTLLALFRWNVGIDSLYGYTYWRAYQYAGIGENIKGLEFGFYWLLCLFSKLGVPYFWLLFVLALLFMTLVAWAISKASMWAEWSVVTFFLLYFYFDSYSALRQSLAEAICLLAWAIAGSESSSKKKDFKVLLLFLTASAFHKIALINIPIYLVCRIKFSNISLIAFMLSMALLTPVLQIVIRAAMRWFAGDSYQFAGFASVNAILTGIIAVLCWLFYDKISSFQENGYLYGNLAVCIFIMILNSGAMYLPFRVFDMLKIGYVLIIPWLLRSITKEAIRFLAACGIFVLFVLWFYNQFFLQDSFAATYQTIFENWSTIIRLP